MPPGLAAIRREELNFKILDIGLQSGTGVRIKAIDQVFLKIAENPSLGVTVFNVASFQESVNFGPRLRLCVLSDHTVEEVARDLNPPVKDLTLESVTHAQHLALVLI